MLSEHPYMQIWIVSSNRSYGIQTGAPHLSSTSPHSVSHRTNLPSMKPIDMKLDMCDANVQKFQRFQISQHINIVLKS